MLPNSHQPQDQSAHVEEMIEVCRYFMTLADNVSEQRCWWRHMAYWIKRRSPGRIRDMELERGLY